MSDLAVSPLPFQLQNTHRVLAVSRIWRKFMISYATFHWYAHQRMWPAKLNCEIQQLQLLLSTCCICIATYVCHACICICIIIIIMYWYNMKLTSNTAAFYPMGAVLLISFMLYLQTQLWASTESLCIDLWVWHEWENTSCSETHLLCACVRMCACVCVYMRACMCEYNITLYIYNNLHVQS